MNKDYKAQKAVAALFAKVATANERGVLDATNCVHHLLSVIEAVADGVLVIAPDIGDEQRREICRELAVMRLLARHCQDELGLEHFSGSCHLQREGVQYWAPPEKAKPRHLPQHPGLRANN